MSFLPPSFIQMYIRIYETHTAHAPVGWQRNTIRNTMAKCRLHGVFVYRRMKNDSFRLHIIYESSRLILNTPSAARVPASDMRFAKSICAGKTFAYRVIILYTVRFSYRLSVRTMAVMTGEMVMATGGSTRSHYSQWTVVLLIGIRYIFLSFTADK